MYTQPLRGGQARSLSLAAAVSLMLAPAGVQAQAPAASDRTTTHKSAVVTVDYVDVPRAIFLKTTQEVALGQGHDARLLAALVKSGAQDTKGPQVQCPDGSTATSMKGGFVRPKLKSGQTGTRLMGLGYATGATPHFNPDGTVTVTLRLQRAEVVPVGGASDFGFGYGAPPPAATGFLFTTRTFHEGETITVANSATRSTAPESAVHLTFVRVATSTEVDGEREPDLSKRSENSVVVTP